MDEVGLVVVIVVVALVFGAALGALAWWIATRGADARQRREAARLIAENNRLQSSQRQNVDELERLNSRVERGKLAFEAWTAYEEQTQRALELWRDELRRARSEPGHVRGGGGLIERLYPVFLDGLPGSGKTTFALRLLNPAAVEESYPQGATREAVRSPPIPVAIEDRSDNSRLLHALYFYDTVGEDGYTVFDCIQRYTETREDTSRRGVLLFVWDCSRTEQENVDHLRSHSNIVYRSKMTLSAIESFVVLFNKVDLLEQRLRKAGSQLTLSAELERLQKLVEGPTLLGSLRASFGVTPQFTSGSMLSGAGLHACYGLILRLFGLAELLQRLPEQIDVSRGSAAGALPARPLARG